MCMKLLSGSGWKVDEGCFDWKCRTCCKVKWLRMHVCFGMQTISIAQSVSVLECEVRVLRLIHSSGELIKMYCKDRQHVLTWWTLCTGDVSSSRIARFGICEVAPSSDQSTQ